MLLLEWSIIRVGGWAIPATKHMKHLRRRFQRGLPAALVTLNDECMARNPSDAHVEQPLPDMVTAVEHAMQPVHDFEEYHGGDDEDFGGLSHFQCPVTPWN